MKLCVFPNDPLRSYYEKGEIKERYFNPNNIFDEIHVISFIDSDIDEESIKKIGGNARLKIHSVGKINIKNKDKNKEKILKLIKSINPSIIRAYNPRIEGWFAAYCAQKLRIPFVLSLHTQHNRKRQLMKKKSLKKYLILKIYEKKIEQFVIKNANKILIVYKIIESYVLKQGGKNPEVLHNSIDLEKFRNANALTDLPKPLVISVGNLSQEKNHQCIIRAMQKINASCIIIGRGEKKKELSKLIESLNLNDKIIMKDSVPYSEIASYYKSADIFALAFDPELEGIPKPVIEAMACGLPVVIPYPNKLYSEGLENIAIFAKNEPDDFSKKITDLLNDKKLQKEKSERSLEKAKQFDISKLETREAEIYSELIKGNNS